MKRIKKAFVLAILMAGAAFFAGGFVSCRSDSGSGSAVEHQQTSEEKPGEEQTPPNEGKQPGNEETPSEEKTETTNDITEIITGDKTFENIKIELSGKSGDKVTISFTVTGASNYKQLGFQTLLDNETWHEAPWAEGGLSDPLNYEVEVTAGADFSEVVFKCFLQTARDAGKSSNVTISNIKASLKSGSGGGNGGNEGDNTTPSDPIDVPTVSGGSFTDHGKLSVSGKQLVDKDGANFILRGVSTHGINWSEGSPFVNKAAFKTVRDEWGVNAIRLAMYTVEYNGYCDKGSRGDKTQTEVQEELKNLIANGVQYATELGMYVIIDWHILHDLTPQTHKETAKAFFTEMASKYANYENVLYEICNEPNGGTQWAEVKSYAEEIIPIIRTYAPDAIIIVGTPNWSQDVDIASQNKISEENSHNVMYTIHFYAAEHKDSYRAKVQTALNNGLPIFCTEFGLSPASGDGALDLDSGKTWLDFFDQNGISYFCWSLCNKNETSALLKSSCTKTSGWTSDDRSEAGNWIVQQYNSRNSN